jgi:GNAT superfamily N-acetyltransferase
MSTRLDLSPWLAGVYVVPEARRRGIASSLVRYAESFAAEVGVGRLYLHTDGSESLYQRLGWLPVGREPYEGSVVSIMTSRIG